MELSWGKPKIEIKAISGTAAALTGSGVLPDAKEGSTVLNTTEGAKTEATVEGGEVEAVRYARNKYTLTTVIRAGAGRKLPFSDDDGVVEGEFELTLTPENPNAPGFKMPRCTIHVVDNWNAADGGEWTLIFDALKPATGQQIVWDTDEES